jgi:hypothetical protein
VVTIAENVSSFKVQSGLNVDPSSIANPIFKTTGVNSGAITVNDNTTQVIGGGDSLVTLSGFSNKTYLVDIGTSHTLHPGRTYKLEMNKSFNASYSQSFIKGTDILGARLVDNNNDIVPGTYVKNFYPGSNGATHQRIFTFTPSEKTNGKPQIYFSFNTPGLPGDIEVDFSSVSFFEARTGAYNWQTSTLPADEKKYVKGFKILLGLTIDGVTRQYSRIVATPNNGL